MVYWFSEICVLASCPWGPVTADGVDLLTEMYVIQAPRSIGFSRRACEGRKEGKLGNIILYRLVYQTPCYRALHVLKLTDGQTTV